MDEVDRANEEVERNLAEALRKAHGTKGPEPTGFCHWCEGVVADWERWCSIECREDWDYHALRKRNSGLT